MMSTHVITYIAREKDYQLSLTIMFKNIPGVFLSVLLAAIVVISPMGAGYASAGIVTDENIKDQETVVRVAARDTVEEYMRFLLYMIILKLEMRVEAQKGK